jgi:hypothetical protein
MAENRIYTKIALKYNDYTYWTTGAGKDYAPLKGEVCFCAIPAGNAAATTAPTVLFKVGVDGQTKFSELKWASALAADVYGWAKEAGLYVKTEGTGNAVTKVEWDETLNEGLGGVKVTKGETFATKQELEKLRGELEVDTNTTYNFSIPTTGADAGKLLVEKKEIGETVWTKVGAFDFVTPAELTTELEGYKTVQTAIVDTPVAGQYISAVSQNENGEITVSRADLPQPPEETSVTITNKTQTDTEDAIYAIANLVEGGNHGHDITATYKAVATHAYVDKALDAAKEYADKKPHENTAHSHGNGVGTVATGAGGISGNVGINLNIGIKLETKTENGAENSYLVIYDATSEDEIASLNAAEFVEDSFLQNVEIDDNNILTFTWNIQDTEGKTKTTEINLEGLVDIYTGETTDTIKVTVDNYKIKAELLKQYKEIQDAVANKITHKAHVLSSLSQDENGIISYEVKQLTLEDIGAAPADDYKVVQEAKTYTGNVAKTVTKIE